MSTSQPPVGWLQLLLDDSPWPAMMEHRKAAVEAAGEAARVTVERDADAAFELRAKLDQRRHRAAELSALNDIAVRLTTVRDLDVLLQTVVDQARGLLRVDLAYVGTVAGDDFTINVTSGALTPQLTGLRFPKDQGLAGLVLSTKAPSWTPDYQADPAFRHISGGDSAAVAENMHGLLGVPLRVGEQILGALFACKRTERQFAQSEVSLLSALAAHAAVAIDNARSFERYQQAVARLEQANRDLSVRTEQLERAIQWDRALTQVVLQGGGVPRLISNVSRLMAKPVQVVVDPSTIPTELSAARDTVVSILSDFAAHPDSRRDLICRRDGRHVVVAQCIHTEDRYLGALVVMTDHSDGLSEADQLLLGRAAPAVALLLAADHYAGEASRRSRDAFVVDLMTHPAATPEDDHRQCRLAGISPGRAYCVAVAEAPDGGAAARRFFESAELRAGSVVAQHGSRVIAVVPTNHPNQVLDALPPDDASTTVGVAGPATGAAGLAVAYHESQQTCDVLGTLGRLGEKSASSQLGIYGILLSHTGREQLAQLTDRLLGPLRDEERKRGTPLIDTLSCYLGHGRRHSETAAALNIHVNTLYQRLDSIDKLIGTQWRNPDLALDLQVVLRLRRSAMLRRA